MLDPRKDAEAYMDENNVNKLFQELSARVMYHRPKDPNKFILEVLESLTIAKGDGTPTNFFTTQDLDAMFALYDPTNRGHILLEQYQHALKTLGIEDSKELDAPSNDRVMKSEFKESILRRLEAESLTKT